MSLTLPTVGVPGRPQPVVKPPTPSSVPDGSTTSNAKPEQPVTLSGALAPEPTYGDPRTETARPDLNALLSDYKQKVDDFMAVLRPLLEQQGLAIDKVVSGEQKLTIAPEVIEKAKADIAEDGEMGVRKVAERILNFAKLGIGDDPAKIETFRAAVQKGFDEAQAMLGGKLPEISQQTHRAIMDELDRWAASGIPSGAVSLAPAATTEKAA